MLPYLLGCIAMVTLEIFYDLVVQSTRVHSVHLHLEQDFPLHSFSHL